MSVEKRNVVIIGAGPAGYAAGLYAGRAQLNPLLLTGREIGGQLSLTLDVENYPGYPATDAAGLIETMQKQAENFGTEVRIDYVTAVDFGSHPFRLGGGIGRGNRSEVGCHCDRVLPPPAGRPRRGDGRARRVLLRDVRRILFSGKSGLLSSGAATRRWKRACS